MIIFITVICIILATAIIALVLLQQGKGSDLGSAFGGGSSNSMFGALGPSGFLGKLTYILVAIWLILSMALAYLVKFDDNKNLFEDTEIVKEEKEEKEDTTGDFPSQ
jgi:preprotein translocase subunit SecG